MELRSLGNTEMSVPGVGVGCNQFGTVCDEDEVKTIVDAALDVGANLFDTADKYADGRSEEFLGEALRGRRDEAIVVTKFAGPPGRLGGGSPDAITESIDGSLNRLKTDYVDIYLMHCPDPETPIEITLEALDALVKSGKVRAIGSSNFSAEQVVEACEVASSRGLEQMVALEPGYSLLQRDREEELNDLTARYGLAILPFRPLARGLLSGKYIPGTPPPSDTRLGRDSAVADELLTDANLHAVAQLQEFAASRGRTLLELAFGWLLSHRAVGCVIAGATSAAQVRENAKASTWRLSDADLAHVESLLDVAVS